ncbi:dihydroxyacetone kinase subunit DhaL [Corynebacterium gerontici]|uniref:PTS-dependent dihydroxyacetone kinase, ADP-binding subunit DhaL n=1 Tax=Corynebacterium gerontici TaxID=2079234 RepID=A0A3G6J2W2_9CORY|nr:dihydroxyacetone kinase subunit DhaL [Corynebacterium gerontici]AZA12401.1 PTS-dependent dihydroxyacetone kinase, ADP-binding subunit DhaL [Corynebacterium gerontici]
MTLGTQWALDWIHACAEAASANRELLIDLDRAIGDADHGENLDRGFQAVVEKLDQQQPNTPGEVLKTTAQVLISTVGGASGPLLGTAFLRASKVAGDGEIDSDGVVALLQAALDGIQQRGKAQEGEKTMVDAWAPAVHAASIASGSPAELLAIAAGAAEAGADATTDMVASKGRASYLGERSKGHKDPGATSSALLIEAAARTAQEAQ